MIPTHKATTASSKGTVYFENLDGIRFICFAMVFLTHSFYTTDPAILQSPIYIFVKTRLFGQGVLGVNVFFVLSGFLITSLLMAEKQMFHKVDIIYFWIRRILRIWPLYFCCVFIGFVVFPFLKQHLTGTASVEPANPWYYFFFLSNFDYIKNTPDASVLSVLWSIGIEEQFYLIWPVLLAIVPIKRYWVIFITVILVSLIWRGYNDSYLLHKLHTISCISDMAVGAFGAWLISESPKFLSLVKRFNRPVLVSIYVTFFVIFIFRHEVLLTSHLVRIFERLIISVVILLILLEQCYTEKSLFKMKNFKVITKLGGITYGFYCLHFMAIIFALIINSKLGINKSLWQVLLVDTGVAFALLLVMAYVSYHFFELPFLRLKNKFAYITKQAK